MCTLVPFALFSANGTVAGVTTHLDLAADVSAEVARSFRKQGIATHVATRVEEVTVAGGTFTAVLREDARPGLARGAVLAEGPYAKVSKDPAVMEAYMGTADSQLEGIGH